MESITSPPSLMTASLASIYDDPLSGYDAMNDNTTNECLEPADLNMDDVYASSPATGDATSPHTHRDSLTSQMLSPPPVIVHSRAAKKRKSWGQTLPEPKTNLAPRKRAKTDDEKEQRRIERIKRNRAAAHNSRERKRQETEDLAIALAHANAELEAYRSLHGPLPANIRLPEVLTVMDDASTPVPSLVNSRSSAEIATPSPHHTLYSHDLANINIKQEPTDSLFTYSDLTSSKPYATSPLDSTQHSAAMLCDLQCRSSKAATAWAATRTSPTTTPSTRPSPRPASPAPWWAQLYLYLMTLQLRHTYQSLLMALWTVSPSRLERLISLTTTRLICSPSTTSSTPTPRLSRSTWALAQHDAATARVARRRGAANVVALARTSGPLLAEPVEVSREHPSSSLEGNREGTAGSRTRRRDHGEAESGEVAGGVRR